MTAAVSKPDIRAIARLVAPEGNLVQGQSELELPAVLHALSDPARLRIVRKLADGDECTCGTFDLGLSKATLSHHFRVLRESGVVRTRPEGRRRLLSLREDDLNQRFPGLLSAVLSANSQSDLEAIV